MEKLRNEQITTQDIEEYLESYSGFSFEITVMKELVPLGFKLLLLPHQVMDFRFESKVC